MGCVQATRVFPPGLDASQNCPAKKGRLEGVPEQTEPQGTVPAAETRGALRRHVKGHQRCL